MRLRNITVLLLVCSLSSIASDGILLREVANNSALALMKAESQAQIAWS